MYCQNGPKNTTLQAVFSAILTFDNNILPLFFVIEKNELRMLGSTLTLKNMKNRRNYMEIL